MTKIKLLLINDIMAGGGAERSMALLANELAKSGKYNIILCSIENKFGYELDSSIKTMYLRENFKYAKLHKLLALFVDWLKIRKIIKKNSIEVVLSFQARSNFTNILAKMSKINYKCIISERIYTKDYYGDGKLTSMFMNVLIKILYKKADQVTCNSKDIKSGLIKYYGVKSENITVINNAYDKNKILFLSQEKLNLDEEKIFAKKGENIVNIGRLEKQKGQSYLIKAFAKIPYKDAKLIFIGDGLLRDELLELAKNLHVEDRVYFLGFKQNPYKFLKRCDLFVFPSLYEGYPNALAEAIILNKKIVSFDFLSGSHELIDEYINGKIVKKYDINALAKEIDLMLKTKTKENFLDNKFDIKVLVDKYLKVLEC